MHSRKSIISRGIVFIVGIFSMMIFSFIKVEAACEVSLNDNNQYLTIGGTVSDWQDDGLKVSGCEVTNLTIDNLTINGKVENSTGFSAVGKTAGHYTVGYNYSYFIGTEQYNGTIYRYIRILNSSFNTNDNYTLSQFKEINEGADNVIDSFAIDGKYFANFVVVEKTSGNTTTRSSLIIVKDRLGRTIQGGNAEIKYGELPIEIKKTLFVSKYTNTYTYKIIANTSENTGVVFTYQIKVDSNTAQISQDGIAYKSSNYTYNNGFISGNDLYLVGKNTNGYPIIEKLSSGSGNEIYVHDSKGEYNGIVVVNQTVYAIGYANSSTSTIIEGLYTYIDNEGNHHSLSILDKSNTIYNDIVYDASTGKNIIVGESAINNIYANNILAATNTRQGYSDGIILQVSLDGNLITNAHMLGGNTNDTFKKIAYQGEGKYMVTGTMNDGVSNLVYMLKSTSTEFIAEIDVTSGNSGYKINGMVNWEHGYAYYGRLQTNNILGVYYPLQLSDGADALLIILDNRTYAEYKTINLTSKDGIVSACNYSLTFGIKDSYKPTNCENITIDTSNPASSKFEYVIGNDDGQLVSGQNIIIYRLVEITKDPKPVNLTSGSSGILRWYVYNRPYTYTENYVTRQTVDSEYYYKFSGSKAGEDIFDMIEYYFENGNTSPYTIAYAQSTDEDAKQFITSAQTTTAFASIEYAKRYAYYQEFSRVKKISGKTLAEIGAAQYVGFNNIIRPTEDYYIYYIDYKGNKGDTPINECLVTKTYITNCTAKGGYAFGSLQQIKTVIETFLQYNNYFVTSRNTIYNGSIANSEIVQYKEEVATTEYLKNIYFPSYSGLNIKVVDSTQGAIVYEGSGKSVYFGGTLSNGKYSYKQNIANQDVQAKTENGSDEVKYYYNNNIVAFTKNACYKVSYYNEANEEGTPREFCFDTTGPIIQYKIQGYDELEYQKPESSEGSTFQNPLTIANSFSISALIDLDEYAFIEVNGMRYALKCSNNSPTCVKDREKYLYQVFKRDEENPKAVRQITFYDRLQNKNTFYFIIGTDAPSIKVEDQTEEGFTIVIDFYKTNPIIGTDFNVVQQPCSNSAIEGENACYSPVIDPTKEGYDENAIIIDDNKILFKDLLSQYISAISYIDGQIETEEELVISPVDGLYRIEHMGKYYKLEDGFFVEHSSDRQEIYTLEENTFDYGVGETKNKYYYNSLTNSLHVMKLVEGSETEYEIDDSIDSIPILDNKFRFEENGKEFEIFESEEGIVTIQPVSKKYEIDFNTNIVNIEGEIFDFDIETGTLYGKNPEVANLMHIEIEFSRSTVSNYQTVGVKLPLTQQMEKDGDIVTDEYTGRPIYEFIRNDEDEIQYKHFSLVDGLYSVTITQGFKPVYLYAEATISLDEVDFNIGIDESVNNLTIADDDPRIDQTLSFGENQPDALNLTALNDSYRYPLPSSIVASSGLGNYENTSFLSTPVYTKFTSTMGGYQNGIFVVKVYQEKNGYGLPKSELTANNKEYCTGVIIFGSYFSLEKHSKAEFPVASTGCVDDIKIEYELANEDSKKALISGLGIIKAEQNKNVTGSFIFNGKNTFYEVTYNTYAYSEASVEYKPTAIAKNITFYLDDDTPNDPNNLDENTKTIIPSVLNNELSASFVKQEDANHYSLDKIVGTTTNVIFNINWYDGTKEDIKENKLLLVTINKGGESATCNLFQLLYNSAYETGCRSLIDEYLTEADTTNSNYVLGFSESGAYEITFIDVTNHTVSYSFEIDKSAPILSLDRVTANNNQEMSTDLKELTENNSIVRINYVIGYLQDPTIYVNIQDSSAISRMCYYFMIDGIKDYEINEVCGNHAPISMNGYEFILDDVTYPSLGEYLASNEKDQNVSLFVWAYDDLGNGGKENNVQVYFWVDYKKPTIALNEGIDPNEEILNKDKTTDMYSDYSSELRYYDITIMVNAEEYSGKDNVQCDPVNGFTFNDARGQVPYNFKITCKDEHDIAGKYPEQYNFPNPIRLEFYEYDPINKVRLGTFNFGVPTLENTARLMYITAYDGMGIEIDPSNAIVVAIMISDRSVPTVVKVEKDEGGGNYVDMDSISYQYLPGKSGNVYLSSASMRVTFSEAIYRLKTCVVRMGFKTGLEDTEYSCDDAMYGDNYSLNDEYEYANRMITFEFANSHDASYKIIIFSVEDFTQKISSEVVLVIDKLAPTIHFKDNGGADVTIEYKSGGEAFGSAYASSGYSAHVEGVDDQSTSLKYTIKYYAYAPKLTYNNYVKNGSVFEAVENGQTRQTGVKYYLKLTNSGLENKKCIIQDGACFVEDTQGYYYFDGFLKDETGNIWNTINEINGTKIGVYRITYYVTDYCGNRSAEKETLYKQVFVSDSVDPNADIYSATDSVLYTNVASEDSNFEGKLNQSVVFKGKDTGGDANTRLVMYRCLQEDYMNGSCNIDQPIFMNSIPAKLNRAESVTNILNYGDRLTDGVYKIFVYDIGQYKQIETSQIQYSYNGQTYTKNEKVYSVTHNTSNFYFAIDQKAPTYKYEVYGNKYIKSEPNVTYKYDLENHYTILNGDAKGDVVLYKYSNSSWVIVDPISLGPKVVSKDLGNGQIAFVYTDTDRSGNERERYRVIYEEVTSDTLYLHETYYKLEGTKQTVCKMTRRLDDVKSDCGADKLYQAVAVTAYIYEEGAHLYKFRDRFNNFSDELSFVVDNTAFHSNKENNKPTGINFWYSVPSKVITEDEYTTYLSYIVGTTGDLNPIDGKHSGKFNSEFFYAFATKEDAMLYLEKIYRAEIQRLQSAGAVTLVDATGATQNLTGSVDDIISQIKSSILQKFIFRTYTTAVGGFGSEAIRQTEGELTDYSDNSVLKSPMYKYVYLKKTTTFATKDAQSKITVLKTIKYTYELVGETCSPEDVSEGSQQLYKSECIKVKLKIVNSGVSIKTSQTEGANKITCLSQNTNVLDCTNFTTAVGDTYVFIDSDVSDNHINEVYYGITSHKKHSEYSESEDIYVSYSKLGEYIELSKFIRYTDESLSVIDNKNGKYIWWNNKVVNLDDILKTNIYKDDKLFTTYYSRYNSQTLLNGTHYLPDASGDLYYDYESESYYPLKDLKDDVSHSYSDDNNSYGNLCSDTNCGNIAIKETEFKIDLKGAIPTIQSNNKMYVELFKIDENTTEKEKSILQTLFEIIAFKDGEGNYTEVYSYALLEMRTNDSPYAYYNINDYIKINGNSFNCIIDIKMQHKYSIRITDRVGNTFTIEFSHADLIPELEYSMNSAATDSSVTITIRNNSQISVVNSNNIKVYKDMSARAESDINYVEYENTACYQVPPGSGTSIGVVFNYNATVDCRGVYKISVVDSYGNSNYIEFIFNPYVINTSFALAQDSKVYKYEELVEGETIKGIIVDKGFNFQVNGKLDYVKIYQYPALSGLAMPQPTTLTIQNFSNSTSNIGACNFVISTLDASSGIYTLSFNGLTDHTCDGIYAIQVTNRFSETTLQWAKYANMPGPNRDIITLDANYEIYKFIEIDTTAPDPEPILINGKTEYYFEVIVDDIAKPGDTAYLSTNKTITYRNQYVAISWGGRQSHSLTNMKYRVLSEGITDGDWTHVPANPKYSGQFSASHLFKITGMGVYDCQFMFTDALGNENANIIFTIRISIETPKVAFFEVNSDGTIREPYENDERIGTRTLLKCYVPAQNGEGLVPQSCTVDMYDYKMVVNNRQHSKSFSDDIELADYISRSSPWLLDDDYNNRVDTGADEELTFKLIVSVKGKPDIQTELRIFIDNKAPKININGTHMSGMYKGNVNVNLANDGDATNEASIYYCDLIEIEFDEPVCKMYNKDGSSEPGMVLVEQIEPGDTSSVSIGGDSEYGYFMIYATDDLGNSSFDYFVLDNQAPIMHVSANGVTLAPYMYTNAESVFVKVTDALSQNGSKFEIVFTPLNKENANQAIEYNELLGLTKEGKYTLTPYDGVNNVGRAITFYIYRQDPKYTMQKGDKVDKNVVSERAKLSWPVINDELVAPIVSVTLDGETYNATYDKKKAEYEGEEITAIGDHIFALIDAAGNRKVVMVTINSKNSNVCINGFAIDVKMQATYNVKEIIIGGEKGVNYEVGDVIIFALPTDKTSSECEEKQLLSYRTLDPKNSHFLIETELHATKFNSKGWDAKGNKFISEEAINEINKTGETVVVFVITKDVANGQLGYDVGRNFFKEDPVGWTIIFILPPLAFWPTYRIFVKKKVRVI